MCNVLYCGFETMTPDNPVVLEEVIKSRIMTVDEKFDPESNKIVYGGFDIEKLNVIGGGREYWYDFIISEDAELVLVKKTDTPTSVLVHGLLLKKSLKKTHSTILLSWLQRYNIHKVYIPRSLMGKMFEQVTRLFAWEIEIIYLES